MPHISYPTPANKNLDIGADFNNPILRKDRLKKLYGADLLAIAAIAKFWAEQHVNIEHNKAWLPAHRRVQAEILRRLAVGRIKN